MKKAAMFILRYISVMAGFFSAGLIILILMIMCGAESAAIGSKILIQLSIISFLYTVTSPITFSVNHFINLSMLTRLLIQTAVNYPLLIVCGALFGWVSSFDAFCKLTTIYFFAGLAASLFICIYYPRKYKRYNDGLRAYKKKALLDVDLHSLKADRTGEQNNRQE